MEADPMDAATVRDMAKRDAVFITQKSNLIAHLHNIEVILRQALCIVVNARTYELASAWKTGTPPVAIAQVMSECAFQHAYEIGVPDPVVVNRQLLQMVVPTLDVLGKTFEDLQKAGTEVEQIYQAFCRTDKHAPAGVGAVQRTSDDNESQEAGECASGGGEAATGESS